MVVRANHQNAPNGGPGARAARCTEGWWRSVIVGSDRRLVTPREPRVCGSTGGSRRAAARADRCAGPLRSCWPTCRIFVRVRSEPPYCPTSKARITADLLPGCHRRRLRSAISVCLPLRLWGSSASRLGGWAAGAGKGRPPASCPAPVLTTRDVPHRVCVRHRAASSTRPRSRPVRPAVAGAAAGRPAPVAGPRRRHAHRGQRVAGHACPPAGTGLPSRLRRDPRPPTVTFSNYRRVLAVR